MTQEPSYFDFLHDVYEELDINTIHRWIKVDDADKRGILQRIDFAFGVRYDFDNYGNLSTIEDVSRDAFNKEQEEAGSGLIPILKKFQRESHIKDSKLIDDIIKSCQAIKAAALCYIIGNPDKSRELISQRLQLLFPYKLNYVILKNGTYSYRMRWRSNASEKFDSPLDLFHIPFSKRNLLKSYRYSVPGYPCLYLSESLYSCWEEMRRPQLDNFFYAGYRNLEDIKLLDLRVQFDLTKGDEIERYLRMLPFIVVCSMQVDQGGDVFVPEYIIPQEVFKWLLHEYRNNRKKTNSQIPFMGIMYTSAMSDVWFEFINKPDEYYLANNMVILTYIPQKDVVKQSYCPYLSGIFETTRPHCYEYEYIKNSAEFFNKAFKREHYSADEVKNYKNSYLSFLEDRLKSCDEWTRVVNVIRKNGK